MIESTFQLAPGIGPYRERQLWAAGVTRWNELPAVGTILSPLLDRRIRAAVEAARSALAERDADALALMLPRRERWRLYAAFADDAGFLDVEADGDGVTVIGILDRDGPRAFLRDRDLDAFPAATSRWKLLVTYNGLAFDAPLLQRTFPDWSGPRAHVDLRLLWGRVGHEGGLKLLEQVTGVGRPEHLASLRGPEAAGLWSAHRSGDLGALRRLVEYNLYDTVNLKALMALGYNRMLERHHLPGAPVPRWDRGDVLYDLTKQVLAVG